jgi:hypothetical protein
MQISGYSMVSMELSNGIWISKKLAQEVAMCAIDRLDDAPRR